MKFRLPKLRFLDKPSGKADRSESNDACINCRAGAVIPDRWSPTRSLSHAFACKGTENNSKNAFGEDINTISTLKCAFCQEKLYIEDGNSSR